jgi:hypothetical protein
MAKSSRAKLKITHRNIKRADVFEKPELERTLRLAAKQAVLNDKIPVVSTDQEEFNRMQLEEKEDDKKLRQPSALKVTKKKKKNKTKSLVKKCGF